MDANDDDDVDLAGRLARGDRTALGEAFDRHAAAVTRYAWAVAASPAAATEAVQDTFVALWDRATALRLATDSLLPWLLVTCRDHARHASEPLAPARGAAEHLRWLEDDLAALSAADRGIVERCLVDGASYTEAADALDLTPVPVVPGNRPARRTGRTRTGTGGGAR